MNPTLAALYGTGIEKIASEEEELDLSQISAADFLEALNELEEEDSEKTAGEFDLADLSDEELVELYNNIESGDAIEKMASSGELEYWDMAGRVMAHAYADELNKTASEEADIDLNELSVEEIIALGQELEKEAAYIPGRGQGRAFLSSVGGAARSAYPGLRRSGEARAAISGAAKRTASSASAAGGRGLDRVAGGIRAFTQRGTAMARIGKSVRAKLPASLKVKARSLSDADLGKMVSAVGGASALAGGLAASKM